MMWDKGFVHTEYSIRCKCGYEERLDVIVRDVTGSAKKQGWVWDPADGWKCEACSKFERTDLTCEIREPVRWFAGQMEQTLKENDYKSGWRTCDPLWLLTRLDDEITELRAAIRSQPQGKSTREEVIREATDVANFAMMIADKARFRMNDQISIAIPQQ